MSADGHEMPERLGRYEIVERLAAGGMGEVFVARFVGPGGFIKPVAVKRIHRHLAGDDAFINMLHDEANVTASLRHPNIVATVDVGADGGDHFVVLDYVSGEPLSRLLRELQKRGESVPCWVAAWVGAQVASALHAAHEARDLNGEPLEVVHRDVSPANIMISDAGHPMLFDFGVAKAKQQIHQTAAGVLKGKLAFMAPESFRGEPVSRQVDVFSLGVVLYELLTGISPFNKASDLETIAALQSAHLLSPSTVGKGVDPRLDPIVARAMAREREDRYRTAYEVEKELRGWAREAGAPHDAASMAAWLAQSFPEQLDQRRELLARVAGPAGRARPSSVRMAAAPHRGPQASLPVVSTGLLETPAPGVALPAPARYVRAPVLGLVGVAAALGGLLALFLLDLGPPLALRPPPPSDRILSAASRPQAAQPDSAPLGTGPTRGMGNEGAQPEDAAGPLPVAAGPAPLTPAALPEWNPQAAPARPAVVRRAPEPPKPRGPLVRTYAP